MNFKNLKKIYIIAEIGVNHNGNLKLAKKLILNAKKAGANAVKFQTFKAEQLALPDTKKTQYQKKNTDNSGENHFQMLKKLELSFRDFKILKKFSDSNKIDFISTPYDIKSAAFLKKIKLKIFKVASADLVDIELNKYLAKNVPSVILSLGMANKDEINKILKIYRKKNKKNIALLNCVSNYPCKLKSMNLNYFYSLKKKGYVYGLSDHTKSNIASIVTASLGGMVIEKHFTLNKNLKGPDHRSSLNYKEFKQFTSDIRRAEIVLGKNIKICQLEEENMKLISRKSIVTSKYIKKGEMFSRNNICLKRPGTGLNPLYYYDKVLTKKSKSFLDKDTIVKIKHF